MKKQVQYYELNRIVSKMKKEFGTIPTGDEEKFIGILFCMEGNLLKIHRMDPDKKELHAKEAIQMCLVKVDGTLRGNECDFSKVITEQNKDFFMGLLESFDPFTNKKVYMILQKGIDLNNTDDLKEYYKNPVKCLLRILQSIEFWTEEFGHIGYFNRVENSLGEKIPQDGQMDYAVLFNEANALEKFGIKPSFEDQSE